MDIAETNPALDGMDEVKARIVMEKGWYVPEIHGKYQSVEDEYEYKRLM